MTGKASDTDKKVMKQALKAISKLPPKLTVQELQTAAAEELRKASAQYGNK